MDTETEKARATEAEEEEEAEAEAEEEAEVDTEVAEADSRAEKRSSPWSSEPRVTDSRDTETTTTTRELRPTEEPTIERTELEEDTSLEPKEATERQDGALTLMPANPLREEMQNMLRQFWKVRWRPLRRPVRREEEETPGLRRSPRKSLTTRPTLN